jgi:hypothetical protein
MKVRMEARPARKEGGGELMRELEEKAMSGLFQLPVERVRAKLQEGSQCLVWEYKRKGFVGRRNDGRGRRSLPVLFGVC